jgi:hypothetical protein
MFDKNIDPSSLIPSTLLTQWKSVEEYPLMEICALGFIREKENTAPNDIIYPLSKGYAWLKIKSGSFSKRKLVYIPSLVYRNFINPEIPENFAVRSTAKDDDPLFCAAYNLALVPVTPTRRGRPKGSKNRTKKDYEFNSLTEE